MPDVRKALVVEGGGMRGIFAAGVLDEFHTARFNPFDLLIGVSSGSVTLASYLSGQYRRYYRITAATMGNAHFLSLRRFLAGGHLMDLDWMWDYAAIHDPLDAGAATSDPSHEFFVGVTDVHTGEAIFLKPDEHTLFTILLASSALPVVYRSFVSLEGRLVADGGVASPIPVEEAFKRGASDITVIRTRPAESPKGHFTDFLMASVFLRRYPMLKEKIKGLNKEYQRMVDFIHHPPEGVAITEIAPKEKLHSKRFFQDEQTIEKDYCMGREAARDYLSHQVPGKGNT